MTIESPLRVDKNASHWCRQELPKQMLLSETFLERVAQYSYLNAQERI